MIESGEEKDILELARLLLQEGMRCYAVHLKSPLCSIFHAHSKDSIAVIE